MRKVFIVNDGGQDFSSAREFGELVTCTTGLIRKDRIDLMLSDLRLALKDSDPDDLILVSGLTSLCMVAAALMTEWHGKVNMLIWHDRKYVARTIDLELL